MPKETLITFVLDESGSMNACLKETIDAFNEYLDKLVETDENLVRVTLIKFNSERTSFVFTNSPLKFAPHINHLNYKPMGATPLYDAILKAIRDTEKRKADARLVIILTDGYENDSETSLSHIKELISAKEKQGWTFVYLGANQDAWAVGSGMGFSIGNTLSYQTSDMEKTMRGITICTNAYISSGSNYTENFLADKDTTSQT